MVVHMVRGEIPFLDKDIWQLQLIGSIVKFGASTAEQPIYWHIYAEFSVSGIIEPAC